MGIVQVNAFVRQGTTFRGQLIAGEPVLIVETGDYSPDVSIFLGNAGSIAGPAEVERQLSALEAAVADARRLWTEAQELGVVGATEGPDGPDDPTDEPTDEPVRRHPGWCLVVGCQIDHDRVPGADPEPVGDDRPAIERYGTPEHEAWLIELERSEP